MSYNHRLHISEIFKVYALLNFKRKYCNVLLAFAVLTGSAILKLLHRASWEVSLRLLLDNISTRFSACGFMLACPHSPTHHPTWLSQVSRCLCEYGNHICSCLTVGYWFIFGYFLSCPFYFLLWQLFHSVLLPGCLRNLSIHIFFHSTLREPRKCSSFPFSLTSETHLANTFYFVSMKWLLSRPAVSLGWFPEVAFCFYISQHPSVHT